MTEKELYEKRLAKMKHALGMDNKDAVDGVYEAYRRSSIYNEPDEVWEGLRADGFAKRITRDDGKEFIYVVTETGMQYVANATELTIRYELTFEPQKRISDYDRRRT